jgi:archaellum component FlaC
LIPCEEGTVNLSLLPQMMLQDSFLVGFSIESTFLSVRPIFSQMFLLHPQTKMSILMGEVIKMEEKMLKLLSEMNQEMKRFRNDLNSFKDGMTSFQSDVYQRFDGIDQRFDGIDYRLNGMDQRFDNMDRRFDNMDQRFDGIDQRFDRVEAKLDGIGHQFEQTNESRLQDVDFITTKVNKLEKEIFIIKSKNNN